MKNHAAPAMIRITVVITALHSNAFLRDLDAGWTALREPEDPGVCAVLVASEPDETAGAPLAANFPELVSRLSRFKSARISAALWERTSRSFSRALLMVRSRSAGTSGLIRLSGVGALLRMASKIAAVVSPRNGNTPVVVSYSTVPKEN